MGQLHRRFGLIIIATLAACGSDAATPGEADSDALAPDGEVIAPDVTFPDTAPPDGTLDIAPDVDVPDTAAEVIAGEFGATCVGNVDCNSGYCVESDAGLICTRTCSDVCPDGFTCRGVLGRLDIVFICVPEFAKRCTPCTRDLDCGRGACLAQDDGLSYCAARCDAVPTSGVLDACGDGFACLSDLSGRLAGSFCQPKTGSCTCSEDDDVGDERACSVTTATGRCSGVETCGLDAGWGQCSAATPQDEACNGRDDDCDGEVDEGLPVGAACSNEVGGLGSCPGVRQCLGPLGWTCDGPTPTPEVCDGVDSDCDGKTDEDFKDANGELSLTIACGICGNDCTTRFANGVGRCGGTSGARACVVERCDDGFVLFGGQCVPPIDTTCQVCASDVDCLGGSCVPFEGANVCAMPCGAGCGAGLSCTPFDVGERCAPTSGSCACTPALAGNQRTCTKENANGRCHGVESCDGAAWSACSAATPTSEICNAADDDCDGEVDEAGWPNLGLGCTAGKGICASNGVFQCDASNRAGPTLCSAIPGPSSGETCDGRDEDCDGQTDEDVTRPACALTRGVCAGATKQCAGQSGFLACSPASYGADYEVVELSCDGRDNDCDGTTDEADVDGDHFIAEACGQDDCDDFDPLVWPGATEIWDAKDNDCNGVVDEGVIPVGTVIITEIMHHPSAANGEYLEVTNLGASVVDLASWQIAGVSIASSVRINPGASVALCKAQATFCSYVDAFQLGTSVALTLAGTEIDRVAFAAFPSELGRALNLDPSQYNATANDTVGNWCLTPQLGVNLLSTGGYGSPQRANPSCSGAPAIVGVSPASGTEHGGDELTITGSGFIAATAVTIGGTTCEGWVIDNDNTIRCMAPAHVPGRVAVSVTKGAASGSMPIAYTYTGQDVTVITWCDLQWPKSVTVAAGAVSELIFGQVRAQGVTESDGEPPGIVGQVGYGPLGSDPRIAPHWVWSTATWNKQFFENDEYKRSLTIPRAGTYSYTYRFTDDGGVSFMYGDFDPGTADGLSPANLGTITVQ